VIDSAEIRRRLADARLYLIYTPGLVARGDPRAALEAALPHVDLVQVRPKPADRELDPRTGSAPRLATTDARELHDLCLAVADVVASARAEHVLVIANDRVDVARSLLGRGVAGVHVGQDDTPARVARDVLGPDALIGLSTHSMAQLARALDEPADYLGFGPVRASATKGYERGLGAEAAWIASQASPLPLFPIGGIGLAEAEDLREVGRAAVSSAILAAEDPAAAARALRELLGG
jgi:thiamine-phosphate pyrophosphorylase